MADLGKRIRTFTTDEPIPIPQFSPVKTSPVEMPAERELVPLKKEN